MRSAYRAEAVGVMIKNEAGINWISQVTLHPIITYGPKIAFTAGETKVKVSCLRRLVSSDFGKPLQSLVKRSNDPIRNDRLGGNARIAETNISRPIEF